MSETELAARLVKLLVARQQTITTVESCTGGLLAGAITAISGASAVFETGYVTYSNAAKNRLVQVPETLLITYGAVSPQVAESMAEGALMAAKASIALSVTGIAGPTGGSAQKPVGMVCFGLSHRMPDKIITLSQTLQFGEIGRDHVRMMSVRHALQWAIEVLEP
ncbi:MAG: CinA family protein [Asticcacaulis sp.]